MTRDRFSELEGVNSSSPLLRRRFCKASWLGVLFACSATGGGGGEDVLFCVGGGGVEGIVGVSPELLSLADIRSSSGSFSLDTIAGLELIVALFLFFCGLVSGDVLFFVAAGFVALTFSEEVPLRRLLPCE